MAAQSAAAPPPKQVIVTHQPSQGILSQIATTAAGVAAVIKNY